LIEKKPSGLLPLLDEICVLNRKTDTDMTYLTTLNNTHRGKSKHFGVSRFSGNNTFIVKHFAGDVVYSVDGFISKNNDKLLPDLETAMLTSKSPFIKSIFENAKQLQAASIVSTKARSTSVSGMGKTPTTIGYNFKNQLSGLYQDILSTTPHYIRCVKPNNNKAPHDFDANMVMEQLKCNGTLEMVRIRREGYPMREEVSGGAEGGDNRREGKGLVVCFLHHVCVYIYIMYYIILTPFASLVTPTVGGPLADCPQV
jgi:myosin heavy subunit